MTQSGQPLRGRLGDEPTSTRSRDGLIDELPAKHLLDTAKNGSFRSHNRDALVPADLDRVQIEGILLGIIKRDVMPKQAAKNDGPDAPAHK